MFSTFLLAASLSSPTAMAPEQAYRARPGAPIYSGLAVIEPHTGRIEAGFRFEVVAEEATDQLAFYLNGAFTITELEIRPDGEWSVEPADFNADWDRITLRFAEPVTADQHIEFTVAYQGTPEMPDDAINKVSPAWVELSVDSAWHPMLASFDQSLTGRLELRLPRDWDVVASGEVSRDRNGFIIQNRIPQLDIAFTAAPELQEVRRERYAVHHLGADKATLDRLLSTAHACADYLDERYGREDRLPAGSFVVAPREESGYARKNYIVLTSQRGRDADDLQEFICHELAHYWSTGAPANSAEDWLNEGFAVYVAARSVRQFFGRSAYEERVADWRQRAEGMGPVWTPEMEGRTDYAVRYKKAPLKLHALEQRIGELTMERFLTAYMTRRIGSTEELLATLETIAGADVRESFEASLAD